MLTADFEISVSGKMKDVLVRFCGNKITLNGNGHAVFKQRMTYAGGGGAVAWLTPTLELTGLCISDVPIANLRPETTWSEMADEYSQGYGANALELDQKGLNAASGSGSGAIEVQYTLSGSTSTDPLYTNGTHVVHGKIKDLPLGAFGIGIAPNAGFDWTNLMSALG